VRLTDSLTKVASAQIQILAVTGSPQ